MIIISQTLIKLHKYFSEREIHTKDHPLLTNLYV